MQDNLTLGTEHGKRYEDLEFSDNFIFCKVMEQNPDLCKQLLELILEKEISEIRFLQKERTLDYLPDSHGIRLDVYVENDQNETFDCEMQVLAKDDLPERSRFYQSMIDMNSLEKGKRVKYNTIKTGYVIFICKFDPFGYGLPVYFFENIWAQSLFLWDFGFLS